MAFGFGQRVAERAQPVEQRGDGADAGFTESSVSERADQFDAFAFAGAFEAEDYRQSHLAFAQIVAGVLAERAGAFAEVEHVVDKLEGDAEFVEPNTMRLVTTSASGTFFAQTPALALGGAIGDPSKDLTFNVVNDAFC